MNTMATTTAVPSSSAPSKTKTKAKTSSKGKHGNKESNKTSKSKTGRGRSKGPLERKKKSVSIASASKGSKNDTDGETAKTARSSDSSLSTAGATDKSKQRTKSKKSKQRSRSLTNVPQAALDKHKKLSKRSANKDNSKDNSKDNNKDVPTVARPKKTKNQAPERSKSLTINPSALKMAGIVAGSSKDCSKSLSKSTHHEASKSKTKKKLKTASSHASVTRRSSVGSSAKTPQRSMSLVEQTTQMIASSSDASSLDGQALSSEPQAAAEPVTDSLETTESGTKKKRKASAKTSKTKKASNLAGVIDEDENGAKDGADVIDNDNSNNDNSSNDNSENEQKASAEQTSDAPSCDDAPTSHLPSSAIQSEVLTMLNEDGSTHDQSSKPRPLMRGRKPQVNARLMRKPDALGAQSMHTRRRRSRDRTKCKYDRSRPAMRGRKPKRSQSLTRDDVERDDDLSQLPPMRGRKPLRRVNSMSDCHSLLQQTQEMETQSEDSNSMAEEEAETQAEAPSTSVHGEQDSAMDRGPNALRRTKSLEMMQTVPSTKADQPVHANKDGSDNSGDDDIDDDDHNDNDNDFGDYEMDLSGDSAHGAATAVPPPREPKRGTKPPVRSKSLTGEFGATDQSSLFVKNAPDDDTSNSEEQHDTIENSSHQRAHSTDETNATKSKSSSKKDSKRKSLKQSKSLIVNPTSEQDTTTQASKDGDEAALDKDHRDGEYEMALSGNSEHGPPEKKDKKKRSKSTKRSGTGENSKRESRSLDGKSSHSKRASRSVDTKSNHSKRASRSVDKSSHSKRASRSLDKSSHSKRTARSMDKSGHSKRTSRSLDKSSHSKRATRSLEKKSSHSKRKTRSLDKSTHSKPVSGSSDKEPSKRQPRSLEKGSSIRSSRSTDSGCSKRAGRSIDGNSMRSTRSEESLISMRASRSVTIGADSSSRRGPRSSSKSRSSSRSRRASRSGDVTLSEKDIEDAFMLSNVNFINKLDECASAPRMRSCTSEGSLRNTKSSLSASKHTQRHNWYAKKNESDDEDGSVKSATKKDRSMMSGLHYRPGQGLRPKRNKSMTRENQVTKVKWMMERIIDDDFDMSQQAKGASTLSLAATIRGNASNRRLGDGGMNSRRNLARDSMRSVTGGEEQQYPSQRRPFGVRRQDAPDTDHVFAPPSRRRVVDRRQHDWMYQDDPWGEDFKGRNAVSLEDSDGASIRSFGDDDEEGECNFDDSLLFNESPIHKPVKFVPKSQLAAPILEEEPKPVNNAPIPIGKALDPSELRALLNLPRTKPQKSATDDDIPAYFRDDYNNNEAMPKAFALSKGDEPLTSRSDHGPPGASSLFSPGNGAAARVPMRMKRGDFRASNTEHVRRC